MVQRKGASARDFRQQILKLVGVGRKLSELAKAYGGHETSIGEWYVTWEVFRSPLFEFKFSPRPSGFGSRNPSSS
jgi:hypothetical protein